MKKKEKEKRGEGVVATIFLSGRHLQRVSKLQSDYLLENNRPISRERAILKLIIGE